MAVSSQAQAQDMAIAGCIMINECSLTEAAVSPNYGAVETTVATREVSDAMPIVAAQEMTPVSRSEASALSVSHMKVTELYLDGINVSGLDESTGIALYNSWDQPGNAPAFSYRFNHRWGFRADAMDEGGPALEAVAAGIESDPEDLLRHLTNPDFSVNLGLIRHF